MEHKKVEARTDEISPDAESRLKIISFPGRKLPSNYHSVVIARWLNSLWKLNKYFKMIDRPAYFKTYETYIKAILARPQVTIRLAALEEDTDVIFGWSVMEGDILHYVHISEPYRQQGLSYDLIPKDLKWVSHITKHWEEKFMKKPKFKDVKFNPFIY